MNAARIFSVLAIVAAAIGMLAFAGVPAPASMPMPMPSGDVSLIAAAVAGVLAQLAHSARLASRLTAVEAREIDVLEARVLAIEERELGQAAVADKLTPEDLYSTNVNRALRILRETSEDARRRANAAPDSP